MNIYQLKKFFYLNIRRSASQVLQDRWVLEDVHRFKRNGFFVELGAFDGITHSNTLLLETKFGWSGICIEANPNLYQILSGNRKCACVNALIGEDNKLVEFISDGVYGRVNSSEENTKLLKTVELKPIPLGEVFEQEGAPKVIDYLSLDVEGYEDQVLINFPFDKYIFLCMSIERPSHQLRALLSDNGYFLVQEVPFLDVFYVHKSILRNYRDTLILKGWNWFLFKINALISRLEG